MSRVARDKLCVFAAVLRDVILGRLALEEWMDDDSLGEGVRGDGGESVESFEVLPQLNGRAVYVSGLQGGVDGGEKEA